MTYLAALAALALSGDPSQVWRTVQSPHFRVHFHDEGEAFARRVAGLAEEALEGLSPQLGGALPFNDVVHIVCTDQVDGANGLAGTLPYDKITLFAFAPEADTDLARADDWLRLLVVHELTHILHLDQISGLWEAVNLTFGKNYLPNHVLPQYFIEGLAVYAESRLAGGTLPAGRVGSAAFEQYLRTATLEGTLPETIGGFTTNSNRPPGGTWAYAFGGDFVSWIAAKHGGASLGRFIHRLGKMLPFGLNTAAREAFGADLPTLFARWRAKRVESAQRFVAQRSPLIEGRRLTHTGYTHHAPTFGPGGDLYVSSTDGWSPEWLLRYPTLNAAPQKLAPCDGGCGHRAVLKSGDVIMASNDWSSPHHYFRDLFRLPAGDPRHRERLTRGLRAREPDLHPSGRDAVFVAAAWGRTALMRVDLRSGAVETLIPYDAGLLLNQPRYLAGGERLLFSAQRIDGFRDLWVREPNGDLRRLTQSHERELAVSVHPDGRHVVAAVDVDDVFDLWAFDLDAGTRRRLTRVPGGALNPTVSPDGATVVYQGWHAAGWDLYAVPFANDEPAVPLVTEREPPPRPEPQVTLTVGSYCALSAAWPRSWAPTLRTTPNATVLSLVLLAQDPAERHLGTAVLDWNTTEMTLSAALGYSYLGARPRLSASLARWPGVGLRYVADTLSTFPTENIFLSGGLDVGLPDVLDPFDLGFDVSAWWSFAPSPPSFAEGHDPGSDVPFQTEDDRSLSLRFRWSYNRVEGYPYSVSSELGVRGGMSFEVSPKPLGNRATTWALTWNAEGFVPMPWLHGHVGALSLRGGVQGGEAGHRGRFFVGGFPEQNLVQDVINRAGLYGTYLRGFAPSALSGEVYVQGSAEYRFPIVDVFRGPGTLPFALERLWGAVWSDAALVYDDDPQADQVAASAGAELVASVQLLYGIPTSLRFGWATTVTPPYTSWPYFVMGASF